MNSSTTISEAALIDLIKYRLLSSIGIATIVLGTVGSLLNILLFTHGPILRQSSCIPYLLGSSIAALPIIYTTVLTRMLLGFQITPLYYSRPLCKLNVYITTVSIVSSTYFTICASADRYFSSSTNAARRNLSNMRNTKRAMAIIIVVASIIYTESLYCYDIGNVASVAPCTNKDSFCGLVDLCLSFSIQFILPFMLMILFGIGTLFNVRALPRRHQMDVSTVAIAPGPRRISKAIDRAILRLVFVQVTCYCACTLPYFIFKIYQNIPVTVVKSDVRRSIENLFANNFVLIWTLDKVCSFYMNTVFNGHFRKELKRIIGLVCHRGRVIPLM